MANYINKEILCESYSRLNIDIYDDKEALEKLRIDITKFFQERATFLFGEGIEFEVEFEEGSLITRVKALGSAATKLAGLIIGYGGFRDGVNHLVDDSILLAQGTNLELIFKTKANYCDRVTFEKRSGILGRTQELIQTLDIAKLKISDEKIPTTQDKLEVFSKGISTLVAWEVTADKLFEKIDTNNDTKACLSAGFLEELEKFPNEPYWIKQLKGNKLQSAVINADINFSSDLDAAASKYSSVLSSLKIKMKKIVDKSTIKTT